MHLLILLLLQAQIGQTELVTTSDGQLLNTGTTEVVIEDINEPVDREAYRLGPGDVLTLTFQGGCNRYMRTAGAAAVSVVTVTSDGMVTLPGVGQLEVMGLNIDEADRQLAAMAASHYPGARLSTALAEPRSLRVRLMGMVNYPGTYVLTAVHRVSDLVDQAGGLSIYGSRLGTMLTAEGDTLDVNLMFDPSTLRRIGDPYLSNNAVVSFPVTGNPVYVVRNGALTDVRGGVVQPVETWDLPDSTDIAEFLGYTGGLAGNVDLARSSLIREDSIMPMWIAREGIPRTLLMPGDTLSLVTISDSVVVSGAVEIPRSHSYVPGWNVREYVAGSGGFTTRARESEVKVVRQGQVVASGREAKEFVPLPGDVIEVPFDWSARHGSAIAVLSTAVGIVSIVYNLLDRD